MQRALRLFLPLFAFAAAFPSLAAEIAFFEHDGFGGRTFVANQSVSNFSNVGYNDRVSSVIVRSGTWQLCSDAYFRGRCVTISAGRYPTLAAMGLNDAVSSAREMDWIGGGGSGGDGGGRVELFEGINFQFRSFAVTGMIRNFADAGYNDRASSMVVYEGVWEACADADFRGNCRTYGPGRYADLAEMNARISSMRPVAAGGGGVIVGGGGWGTGSRAILYERANLSGRSYAINDEVAFNLAATGFNDRASSLRVEAGYWIFCSEANFQGDCQTFGPGEYPTLPWGLQNRISSGRRIHAGYPYNQNPMWNRQ